MHRCLHPAPGDALGLSIIKAAGKTWNCDEMVTTRLGGVVNIKLRIVKLERLSQCAYSIVVNRNDAPWVELKDKSPQLIHLIELRYLTSINMTKGLSRGLKS